MRIYGRGQNEERRMSQAFDYIVVGAGAILNLRGSGG